MDVLDEILGAGVDGDDFVRLCRASGVDVDVAIVEEFVAGSFALLVPTVAELAVPLGRENGRRGREGAPFLMNSSKLGLLIIDFVRLSYPQWRDNFAISSLLVGQMSQWRMLLLPRSTAGRK